MDTPSEERPIHLAEQTHEPGRTSLELIVAAEWVRAERTVVLLTWAVVGRRVVR